MKNCIAPKNPITHRILLIGCAVALAVALTVSLTKPAYAGDITVPPVPDNINPHLVQTVAVKVFLEGHAVGTQNYICLPCAVGPGCPASGFAYSLLTPQATLFNDDDEQIITHFFSINPFEPGTIRATWQHSHDSSVVWAGVFPNGSSTDANFVATGAIPWLLLESKGGLDGPTGGDRLTEVSFVQRLNTRGGVAPSTGCASSSDVGTKAFVPYRADYFFYRNKDK